MVGEKESWSSSSNNNNSSCSKQWTNISTDDSINNQNLQYNIISNPSNWCWVTKSNLPCKAKPSDNQTVFIFSFMLFWIDSHIDSNIWIVWNWNAFQVFACLHISSYSSIQSIQIVIQLMSFPESIDKMLSLIHDNSRISNNMIIIKGCFFPFFDK